MDAFSTHYAQLNTAQKKAVDTIDGPVLVVAGPGTGKTQMLSLRIASILQKTDTAPEQILAVTFTEAAVANMRARLASFIGAAAYRVPLFTFHGLAEHIIRTHPESFPRIIGARPITDVEQIELVQQLILETPLTVLRPFNDPTFYLRDIIRVITTLKQEGINPSVFRGLVEDAVRVFEALPGRFHEKGVHAGKMKGEYKTHEKMLIKNTDLVALYERYQEALYQKKVYDFSDMIREVVDALQADDDLLLSLQEQYHYFLIDEHQDSNNAQNKLLELLASYHAPRPNLFVVGDEKQAIYRFQGASLENFYYFQSLYPDAVLITLSENYRSTKRIIEASAQVLPSSLTAVRPHENHPLCVTRYPDTESERIGVVQSISTLITEGVAPDAIAVLYRTNADAFGIAAVLKEAGIRVSIESDQSLFTEPIIKKWFTLLKGIATCGDPSTLAETLHLDCFSIAPLSLYAYIHSGETTTLITDALEKIQAWKRLSMNADLETVYTTVLKESGIAQGIGYEAVEALTALYDQVRVLKERIPEASLLDFVAHIEMIKKEGVALRKKRTLPATGAVRLMTVHRAKGLEFDHVFIIHAYSGHFGDKRSADYLPLIPAVFALRPHAAIQNDNDDERRLFYVALTRAKEQAHISYATTGDDGRMQLPASFITEIDPALLSFTEGEPAPTLIAGRRYYEHTPLNDTAYSTALFEKRGLSPTTLNNYLSCPWKYFYQNLIQFPQVPTLNQSYGIAIHGALEIFFKHYREHIDTPYVVLSDAYEALLKKQKITEHDRATLLARGTAALEGWYETYQGTWVQALRTEVALSSVIDTVPVKGKLDKIEYLDDGTCAVIDYKTGKGKSRNELQGLTKNSSGDYYRQLVFYKLLLEATDSVHPMAYGVIDFVQPDENGKYQKELFAIPDEEVTALRATITRVAEEIRTLSFWNTQCDDAACQYCQLRSLMAPHQ